MNDLPPIRILIVDDHPMVRSGLHDFIFTQDGLELVGEAQNGVEAVEFCATHEVDVVLMDLVMPLMDGSEATRRILALGKPVSVSAALPEQSPQMAVDGDFNTQWSAGAFPTQWIEVDLGVAYTVGEIRLTVGQWPAGDVLHQLWVGPSQENMQRVYEFSGHVYDYDMLNFVPDKPLNGIRFVRIVTTESPSWVSWREIEVLVPFPGTPTATPELAPIDEITPTP